MPVNGDVFLAGKNRGCGLRRQPGRPKYRPYAQWANPGKGIKYSIEGDELVLRFDLKADTRVSTTGKSMNLGHTAGPLAVECLPCAEGHELPKYLLLMASLCTLIDPIECKQKNV